jgi:hypothetical protein
VYTYTEVSRGGLGLPVSKRWDTAETSGRYNWSAILLWVRAVYRHRSHPIAASAKSVWGQKVAGGSLRIMDHRHAADPAVAMDSESYEMDDVDKRYLVFHPEMLCCICMAVSTPCKTSLMIACAIS